MASRARAGAVLLLFTCLVVRLTWPLGAHLATHRPDIHPISRVDPVLLTWALAWETHALTTAPLHVADANIYHPTPDALFYGQGAFGLLPYFAPTFLLTGNPTLAMNLSFLGCIILTAWTIHLAVRRWTGMESAGVVAGWSFLTNQYPLRQIALATNLAALQYVAPLADRRARLALVLLVALQCLTDPMYVAPAVALPLALVGVARCARPSSRIEGVRLLGALALASLAILPVYAGFARVAVREPGLAAQVFWPAGAAPLPPFPWRLVVGATAIPLVALPIIALGGICALARLRRGSGERAGWAQAMTWTVAGLVLANAPAVPPLRMTGRLGTGAMVGLSLLTGLALAELLRFAPVTGRWRAAGRLARVALVGAIAYAMLVDYRDGYRSPLLARSSVPLGYQLQEVPIPNPGAMAALERLEGPVLDVPLMLPGTVGAPVFHAGAMYRSIFHWHPLLNGYHSYWPAGWFERMELARKLPDPLAVWSLRRRVGLALVLVNLDEMVHVLQRPWLLVKVRGGNEALKVVFADDRTMLLVVLPPPPDQAGAGMRRSAAIAMP
jgi:hypothetical protein